MVGTNHSYSKEHAEFYDARIGAAEREDESFYIERAQEEEGPVLELACGTGRIYLGLLSAGIDADGFDLSADALAVLRESASEADLEPSVWQANMTDFEVSREYDLAICPFNAFQHLLTVDAQLSALQGIHDALALRGKLILDTFVPSFEVICETYGQWRTETVAYRNDSYEFRTRSQIIDEVEQQFVVENELWEPDGARVFTEDHRLKILPKREMELLAHLSPFADWRATGDFDRSPIADGDSIQVWTLSKDHD
jgi:SAM-dependent methyltransferase